MKGLVLQQGPTQRSRLLTLEATAWGGIVLIRQDEVIFAIIGAALTWNSYINLRCLDHLSAAPETFCRSLSVRFRLNSKTIFY